MKDKNNRLAAGQLLYDAALIIFLFQGIFRNTLLVLTAQTSVYLTVIQCLYLISMALLAVKAVFFDDIFHSPLMRSIPFWIFSILLAVSTVISRNPAVFSVWMFAAAYKNIRFEKEVRTAFITELIVVGAIILLSAVGILPTAVLDPEGVYHPMNRYSLGFLHPNSLGLYLFHIVCCFVYLRRNKSLLPSFLVVIAVSIFNYFVPSSRTPVLSSVLLLICISLNRLLSKGNIKNADRKKKIFSGVLIAGTVCAMAGSFMISFFYDLPVMQKIDTFFSGRFSSISRIIASNQITWFGRAPFSVGGAFDNSYMWILLHYGILIYLSVSILMVCLMVRLSQEKRYEEMIFLFIYSFYAMMETELFVANKCIFVLLFGLLLFDEKAAATTRETSETTEKTE